MDIKLTKKIVSPRLLLRPFKVRDARDVFEYSSNPAVGPNAGWPPHKSLDETRNILRGGPLSQKGTYAITLRDTKRVIGSIGLHSTSVSRADESKKALEIGYALSQDYWGHAYAPEAFRALAHYAFKALDLDLLWCAHFDFNQRSKRVCEKMGLTYAGTKMGRLDLLDGREVVEILYTITGDQFYALNPGIDEIIVF